MSEFSPLLALGSVPSALKELPNWVRWKQVLRDGKPTKEPYSVSGLHAKTDNSSTWDEIDAVCDGDWPLNGTSGLGFVLSESDPFTGIDLDKCRNPQTGEITDEACRIIKLLNSWTEISPSGCGCHVWVRGSLKPGGRRRKGCVEMYDSGRYLTVTGNHLAGTPLQIHERQAQLDQLQTEIFEPVTNAHKDTQQAPPSAGLCDEDLLSRARGSRTDFAALYDRGDISRYQDDDSAGDMALANHLAFWTGREYARMDRLFRGSALMRAKWDEAHFGGGETYGAHTLNKAIRDCTDTYEPGRRPEPSSQRSTDARSGNVNDVALHGVDGKAEGLTKAQTLIGLANAASFFRTDDRETYASFSLNGHKETWAVKSMAFRDWLIRSYYRSNQGRPPGSQALQDALSVIEANARIEAPKRNVALRVGEHEGHIYIDLADDQWRAIKITTDGWSVVPDPPVLFRRTKGMLPLPVPEPGGSLEELRPLLNADDESFVLIVAAMVGWLRPRGPFPLLIVEGEQGSAKTATARIVRSFVDPSMVSVRKLPHDDADLAIAAKNTWLLAYDNLSGMSSVFSDVFCQIATGSGFARRELYTDSDEALFNFQRPVILNGIDEICTKPDLIDRSLIVNLSAIPSERRRTEEEMQEELTRISPRVFGALLDAIAMALRRAASVRLPALPRMADFAKWISAAEPALPWAPGTFMSLYLKSRGEATAVAMESDPLALAVQRLVEKSTDGLWTGSAKQLLTDLHAVSNSKLPRSANALSGRLKRCAPLLREVAGIQVDRSRGRDRGRLITLRCGRSVYDLKTSTERSTGTSSGFSRSDVTDNKDKTSRQDDVADRNDDSPYSSMSLFFCHQRKKRESRKDGENIDTICHTAQPTDNTTDSTCTISKHDLPPSATDLPPNGACPSCGCKIFWRRWDSADQIACEKCYPPPPEERVEFVAPCFQDPAA